MKIFFRFLYSLKKYTISYRNTNKIRLLRFSQKFQHHLLWQTSYTNLFPKDMIQDIYSLQRNAIRKSIGVAWYVGPYKLIRLPGHPNPKPNLIKYNRQPILTIITILIITLNNLIIITILLTKNKPNYNINPDYYNNRNHWKFSSSILKTTITIEKQ